MKAQMPAVTPHPEIYDEAGKVTDYSGCSLLMVLRWEAMDFLTIFKLSRHGAP